eukprot:TRINITY_DN6983_c0_g1_i3.p1 TRINITY_DN6983_c0_g1~~TRINITY_DN6983_c0_g1_i3.p1  ORF type:complete len:585 (+),score=136.27 TRINITY_DN6983_c0_g1_i3:53-1807(+)
MEKSSNLNDSLQLSGPGTTRGHVGIIPNSSSKLNKFKLKDFHNYENQHKFPLQSIHLGWAMNSVFCTYKNTPHRLYFTWEDGFQGSICPGKIIGFGDGPKFSQCNYPNLVTVYNVKGKGDLLQIINLEDIRMHQELELMEEFKTIHLFCDTSGFYLLSSSSILHYPNFSLSSNKLVQLEKKIPFLPNSLSSITDNMAVITNGRKILLFNLHDGKLVFENKLSVVLPFLRVVYYDEFIVSVNVNQILLFNTKTSEEIAVNYSPSPTCCLPTNNLLLVGDSEGNLNVLNFKGEILYAIGSSEYRTKKSKSNLSLSDTTEICIQKLLPAQEDIIAAVSGNALTLWQLKEETNSLRTLVVDGKITNVKEHNFQFHILVNDDEYWVWKPTYHSDGRQRKFSWMNPSSERSSVSNKEYMRAKSSSSITSKASLNIKKNSYSDIKRNFTIDHRMKKIEIDKDLSLNMEMVDIKPKSPTEKFVSPTEKRRKYSAAPALLSTSRSKLTPDKPPKSVKRVPGTARSIATTGNTRRRRKTINEGDSNINTNTNTNITCSEDEKSEESQGKDIPISKRDNISKRRKKKRSESQKPS